MAHYAAGVFRVNVHARIRLLSLLLGGKVLEGPGGGGKTRKCYDSRISRRFSSVPGLRSGLQQDRLGEEIPPGQRFDGGDGAGIQVRTRQAQALVDRSHPLGAEDVVLGVLAGVCALRARLEHDVHEVRDPVLDPIGLVAHPAQRRERRHRRAAADWRCTGRARTPRAARADDGAPLAREDVRPARRTRRRGRRPSWYPGTTSSRSRICTPKRTPWVSASGTLSVNFDQNPAGALRVDSQT